MKINSNQFVQKKKNVITSVECLETEWGCALTLFWEMLPCAPLSPVQQPAIVAALGAIEPGAMFPATLRGRQEHTARTSQSLASHPVIRPI